MNDGFDDGIPRWFERFNRERFVLRNEVLDPLESPGETVQSAAGEGIDEYSEKVDAETQPQQEVVSPQVQKYVTEQPYSRRAWLGDAVPRVAASLGMAAAGGGLLFNTVSQPLYAIEKVVDRMCNFDRVYMRGTRLDGQPFELYIERPYRFWVTYQISAQIGDERLLISSGHRASDGLIRYRSEEFFNQEFEHFELGPFERSYVQQDLLIWSQLETERLIREILGEDLFYPDSSNLLFQGRRKSKYQNDQVCDVFERQVSAQYLHRLYVDPASHTPVQAEGIQLDDGRQQLRWRVDEIVLDPNGPPRHIQFKTFGKHRIPEPCSPLERFYGEPQVKEICSPFQLQLGRICLCPWTANPQTTDDDVSLSLMDRDGVVVPCPSLDLGATFDGSTRWQWQLWELPGEIQEATVSMEYTRLVGDVAKRKNLVCPPAVKVSAKDLSPIIKQMATAEQTKRILWVLAGHRPKSHA